MTGTIRTIAVNQSETLIAVGFSTGAISLLESRTGTLVASWKGGDTEITMVNEVRTYLFRLMLIWLFIFRLNSTQMNC